MFIPNGKMSREPIKDSAALGERIRARRKELELTQGELADVSQVTLRFVSELERGKATAQYAGIQRVLAALGLDLYLESR
jgi:HTH-type transcriptional regulator/antitoxin HipB